LKIYKKKIENKKEKYSDKIYKQFSLKKNNVYLELIKITKLESKNNNHSA
jgi:hypothetical protein